MGRSFWWNFFEQPKEILRPADLNPSLSDQAFAIIFFSYVYWNTVLLRMMGEIENMKVDLT